MLFIISEFFSGIGLGISGLYIFSFFDNWDLFSSILFSIAIMSICALTGIGLVGYFYLKQIDRQHEFLISMVLSFFGLFVFLVLSVVLDSWINQDIPPFIYFILLAGGAVAGFHLKTMRHMLSR